MNNFLAPETAKEFSLLFFLHYFNILI